MIQSIICSLPWWLLDVIALWFLVGFLSMLAVVLYDVFYPNEYIDFVDFPDIFTSIGLSTIFGYIAWIYILISLTLCIIEDKKERKEKIKDTSIPWWKFREYGGNY